MRESTRTRVYARVAFVPDDDDMYLENDRRASVD